jgi:hypothetical protein
VKQSTSLAVSVFGFDANGDGVTGIIDGSWTKRISKNGAAFAAMTVTITEMENGWYSLTLSTAHTDTLGILSLSFSAAGVKRVNLQYRVHARVLDDLAFPTTTGRSMDTDVLGGIEVGSFQGGAITAAAFTAGAIDAAAIADAAIDAATFATGAISATAIATDAIGALEFSQGAADKIWASATRTLSTGAIVAATFGAGAIDAAAIATDAIGAAEFSQAAADKIWASTTRTLSTGAIVAATFGAGAIDAAAIATDAIGAAEFSQAAADKVWASTTRTLSTGAITTTTFAAGAINAAAIADGAIDAATFAAGAIDAAALAADAGTEIGTAVWASATRTLTAFSFSVTVGTNSDKTGYSLLAGSIAAATFAAGAIDANALAADAAAEIRDSVWAKAMTELAAVPGVTGTVLNALEWCFLLSRNKRLTTASTETLRNGADTLNLATANVADDAVTFTRNLWT